MTIFPLLLSYLTLESSSDQKPLNIEKQVHQLQQLNIKTIEQ